MDSEEKNLITQFFARVGGGQGVTKALPPIDQEANQLIAQEFNRYPDAPYRVTQLAVVQEEALVRANQRIQQLQAQLQQANSQRGGFFSNLFGGQRAQQMPPRRPMGSVPPVGAPYGGYAPHAGTGFLGSALTTAAGVAGGMLAAEAIESMFEGHHGAAGMGSGMDTGFGADAVDASDPFSGSGAEVQGYDDSDFGGGFDDGGFGGDDFGGDFDGDSMF